MGRNDWLYTFLTKKFINFQLLNKMDQVGICLYRLVERLLFNTLKSIGTRSRYSELTVILQVSAVEGYRMCTTNTLIH